MRRLPLLLLAVLVGCAEVQEDPPVAEHPGKPTPEVFDFAKANNRFAFDLYAKLGEKPGNVFFSPYSVSTTMAMVYAGANGTTADEIARAMHFTPDAAETARLAALLERQLTSPVPVAPEEVRDPKKAGMKIVAPFFSGNALWTDHTCFPKPDFVTLMSKEFRGEYRKVDFKGNPKGACGEINRWVEKRTRNRIPKLLDEKMINSTVRLVLTNAIAFDGEWLVPFDSKNTKPQPFFLAPDQHVDVPTMAARDGEAMYKQEAEFGLLDIPLQQRDFDVLFAIPVAEVSLPSLEAKLTESAFFKAYDGLSRHMVDLTLPTFTLKCPRNLNDELQRLGIVAAFTSADFSKLSDEGLTLAAVEHNATVTVDEIGTRAAAATAAVFTISLPPMVTVHVDRPFLMFVVHRPTRTILFQGRIVDPR
jgi:serpin B